MFFVAVLLLIVAPLVELYVIIQVAQSIGGWNTLGLLLLMGLVGGWLLKQQGLSVLRRIQTSVQAGRSPDKELVDGLLILVAGALMLAPGFVGDVIGLFLLAPPTRAIVRAPLMKRFREGRAGVFAGRTATGGRFVGTFRVGGSGAGVYDVTGHDSIRADDDRPELDP
ncbi:MAG: FxsA family protein [Actinobacteria bacterium]|nr:FxsA family protein [Actinomycetota bacterium]